MSSKARLPRDTAADGVRRDPQNESVGPGGEHAAPTTRSTLLEMKKRRERIVMVTAYDYPFARLADRAGVDVLLVGDTLGMVVLGFDNTLPVTMDHMLHHTQAVARARPRGMIVTDMPFMSYQVNAQEAVRNAGRLVQEGGAQAVKLEGGLTFRPIIEAIVTAGIPVMGHVGLLPQSIHQIGGYRVQGRDAAGVQKLLQDARALQEAGCFSVVLEAIPLQVSQQITEALEIPTIGIGAGPHCDGQVLVLHDLLGLESAASPKFVRRYADLSLTVRTALEAYVRDVRSGRYPDRQHSYGR